MNSLCSIFHHKNFPPTIILIVILILGSYLRFNNLGETSLWIDEGYSINAALEILDHGSPLLESGNTYTNQLLNSYTVAGSIKLFDFTAENPWQARLPSAIFGVLVIVMTFILTRRLFGNDWVALGAAACIAFLPWEIAWSRQARGYTMIQFFILFSLDQLVLFFDKQKIKNITLSVVGLVLGFFTHAVAMVFVPGILFSLVVWYLIKIKKLKLKSFFVILVMLALGYFIGWPYLKGLEIYNFIDFYNTFIYENFILLCSLAIFGLIGTMLKSKDVTRGSLLASSVIFSYIIISAYGPLVHYRYLVPILPLLSTASAYGIYLVANPISKKIFSADFYRGVLIFSIIIITLSAGNILIFKTTSRLYTGSPQPDFNKAYAYIKNNKTSEEIVISPYAHLTKIYLGEPEILLPISLTGKNTEASIFLSQEIDYYTGAPSITEPAELFKKTREASGYIILDSLAQKRIGDLWGLISNHPVIKEVFYSKSNTGEDVWVYKF